MVTQDAPARATPGIETNKLGMALFLFAEANFFGALILAYVYYHVRPDQGLTAASALDPVRTGLFSLCLIASSFTLWQAERRAERSRGHALGWLLGTIGLGAVFLVGQLLEYRRLLSQDLTISANLFGTTFFTLTGFHGLHVLIGLLALVLLFWQAVKGRLAVSQSSAVAAVSLYWHFVDAVWIVIFTVVYVWSRL